MSKTYLPYDPDQQLLLPAALQEWLPDDHLAYFISDVVDQLDLSSITARYEQRKTRRAALPSADDGQGAALRLLHRGGFVAKRIAQRLHEDIAFRVLAANNTPVLPHHLRLPQGPPGGAVGVYSCRCWRFASGRGW